MKGKIVLALAFFSAGCLADEYDLHSCRNGYFPTWPGVFNQAKVKVDGDAKVHFYRDDDGCPGQGETCATKPYLVAGDTVLVAQEVPGWSCVWYSGKKHEFVGWMPTKTLEKQPINNATLAEWTGKWRAEIGDNEIHITSAGKGQLNVNGQATWYGGKNAAGYEVVHTGDLDETITPQGNALHWGNPKEEYSCSGTAQLVNGKLIVHDSGYCGGMNVSFDNVYHKQ
ncbi:hypothetical protein SAMN05216563_10413 [Phytobacter palmae]|nr:hypothetical protein SAMN05216563_10413 [Phytobacter palmae]